MLGKLSVFLSAAWIVLPSCSSAGEFSAAPLGPVPDPVNLVLAPDKQHVAYVVPFDDRKRVYFDGQPLGSEFDGTFVESSFVLSSDGRRTAYAVVKEDRAKDCVTCGPQGKWHAVIDGEPGTTYDGIHGLGFSPNGQDVAYAAVHVREDKSTWQLVRNGGATILPYEAISRESPVFTPDSQHLVYIAKKGERAVVVIDGKEHAAFDRIAHAIPVFSEKGKHAAYVAMNFDGPDAGKERVVLDGKLGPAFDHIPPQSLLFSPDGTRLAYGARTGGVVPGDPSEWTVVLDGQIDGSSAEVDHLVFSADGRHFAYKAKRGESWQLVLDGKPLVTADALATGFPIFSPDSRRIAYGYKRSGGWTVRIDVIGDVPATETAVHGVVGENFDDVGLITFSGNGARLAFVARKGKKRFVVVDGKAGSAHDAVENLLFSPDGKRVAYEAAIFAQRESDQDDRWFVVIDGQPWIEHRPVRGSLVFSRDGKHVGFLVMNPAGQQAVIDGVLGPPYKTLCGLVANGANGFESIAVGDMLYRMTWTP